MIDSTSTIGGALHSVTPDVIIWIVVGSCLLVVCLCLACMCLCARHAALQRTSALYRLKLEQYRRRREARLGSAHENASMTLEDGGVSDDDLGGDGQGVVLTGVVNRVST